MKVLQREIGTKNQFFHKIRYEEVMKLESPNQTLFPNEQKH